MDSPSQKCSIISIVDIPKYPQIPRRTPQSVPLAAPPAEPSWNSPNGIPAALGSGCHSGKRGKSLEVTFAAICDPGAVLGGHSRKSSHQAGLLPVLSLPPASNWNIPKNKTKQPSRGAAGRKEGALTIPLELRGRRQQISRPHEVQLWSF